MKDLKDKAIEWAMSNALGIPFPMTAIQAYIAGATEAMQWISVDDELPKEHKDVVAVYEQHGGTFTAVSYFDGEDWYTSNGEHIRPTHWLPIPEPPKTTDK